MVGDLMEEEEDGEMINVAGGSAGYIRGHRFTKVPFLYFCLFFFLNRALLQRH